MNGIMHQNAFRSDSTSENGSEPGCGSWCALQDPSTGGLVLVCLGIDYRAGISDFNVLLQFRLFIYLRIPERIDLERRKICVSTLPSVLDDQLPAFLC